VRQRGTTQQLVDLPVAVSDLGPGLEATVEPATLDVIVFANDETLSDLRGGDVEPTVSVEGRGPGTYVLTPIVAVPPALQWVRSEPETVRVVIRETDATPSASPTRQWP
jgi:hypothetical protein